MIYNIKINLLCGHTRNIIAYFFLKCNSKFEKNQKNLRVAAFFEKRGKNIEITVAISCFL